MPRAKKTPSAPENQEDTVTVVKEEEEPVAPPPEVPEVPTEPEPEPDLDLDEDYEGGYQEDGFAQTLFELLTNERGQNVAEIFSDIRDAMDKQNKILYKMLGVMEAKIK
jgi:hypothetical protein